MGNEQEDGTILKCFMFSRALIYKAHEIEFSVSTTDPIWPLLHDIAEGKLTLVSSPAEIGRGLPLPEDFKDFMWASVNQRIADEREMATRIIEGYRGLASG